MKCQFIDNDDFFEEYILNRIGEDERRAFEGHLSGCTACSEKLAQQKKMLAGIREIGRTEMKAEIKQQAELASSKRFNWVAVTRIAALAFILILTPTMYYIYKNQVQQPASAPLAYKQTAPDNLALELEFTDELASLPAEKETIDELKRNHTTAASNALSKTKSRLKKNLPTPQLSRQAPELQIQLKRKIAKEDSKTEQPGVQDLDEAIEVDAIFREQTKFGVADDEPTALPENESVPARLNSISGAASGFEKQGSGIPENFFSSGFLKKDENNVFSRIINLNGRRIDFRLIIKPDAEASPSINWPNEFPASVARPDSNSILLKGKLPFFQNTSTADFSAKGISENEIEIRFGETATYRIKIDRADSKAIRID